MFVVRHSGFPPLKPCLLCSVAQLGSLSGETTPELESDPSSSATCGPSEERGDKASRSLREGVRMSLFGDVTDCLRQTEELRSRASGTPVSLQQYFREQERRSARRQPRQEMGEGEDG